MQQIGQRKGIKVAFGEGVKLICATPTKNFGPIGLGDSDPYPCFLGQQDKVLNDKRQDAGTSTVI